MGMFFIYSIKVAICLAVFYLFYKLLLSRDTFHSFNRVVLLTLMLMSLLLPFVSIPVNNSTPVYDGIVQLGHLVAVGLVSSDEEQSGMTLIQVLFLIYIIGVAVFFVNEICSLVRLYRLITGKDHVRTDDGVNIIVIDGDIAPFSWFNNIVISRSDYESGRHEIIIHEKAHIAHGHSYDIMLCNLLLIFQWFNPAAWLLRRELQNIHEYQADEAVILSGADAAGYQLLLIRKAVGDKLFSMANNLNQCSLKKRITMMLKKKSNPWRQARTLLVVPVAAVAIVAFATPKAESLSNEIRNESDALVSAVLPADNVANADKATSAASMAVQDAAKAETMAQSAGEVTEKSVADDGGDDEVMPVAEQMPEFPGGQKAMMKWLMENIKYPGAAAKAGKEGRVIVKFVVDKQGNVTKPVVARGVDESLDAEALRVVKAMPKWTPGRHNGKVVSVEYTLPVSFRIDGPEGNSSVDLLENLNLPVRGTLNMTGNLIYVVDGKKVDDVKGYDLSDIESMEMRNDKKTIEKYGDAAKNGVIFITTKKK